MGAAERWVDAVKAMPEVRQIESSREEHLVRTSERRRLFSTLHSLASANEALADPQVRLTLSTTYEALEVLA